MSEDHRLDVKEVKTEKQTETFLERTEEQKQHTLPDPMPQQEEQPLAQSLITSPKLSYRELAGRIRNKHYDQKTFLHWKRKQSESMEQVTEAAYELVHCLESDATQVGFKRVKQAYERLNQNCLTYLSTHHPKTSEGKARYALVEQISFRVSTEMRYIDANVMQYEKGEQKIGTEWKDILLAPPVVKMEREQVAVPKEAELGATSTVRTLTEGSRKYYFKKREIVPACQTKQEFLAEILKEFPKGGEVHAVAAKLMEYLLRIGFGEAEGINKTPDEVWKWIVTEKKVTVTEQDKKVLDVILSEYDKKVRTRNAAYSAKIPLGADLSKRNEATSAMAELLGISDIIVESRTMTLEVDGVQTAGLRMQEAKGIPGRDGLAEEPYKDMKVRMTPEFVKKFTMMKLFDIICGQNDRNQNNFLVQPRIEGREVVLEKFTGIDHDMSFGLLTFNDLLEGGHTMIPKESRFFAVDREFADRILALTPEMLYYTLCPYLGKEEISACQDRLKGLQQVLAAVKEKDKERPDEQKVLISSQEEWQYKLDEIETPVPDERLSRNKQMGQAEEHWSEYARRTGLPKDYIVRKRDPMSVLG